MIPTSRTLLHTKRCRDSFFQDSLIRDGSIRPFLRHIMFVINLIHYTTVENDVIYYLLDYLCECSYPLSSTAGSNLCSFCKEGFYLDTNAKIDTQTLVKKPLKYCLECPTSRAVHWQTFFALQANVLVVNCYRYTQIFGRIPQNHATARSD